MSLVELKVLIIKTFRIFGRRRKRWYGYRASYEISNPARGAQSSRYNNPRSSGLQQFARRSASALEFRRPANLTYTRIFTISCFLHCPNCNKS